MRKFISLVVCLMMGAASLADAAGDYRGDERCPPPQDWSNFSPPYNPYDYPYDFPLFEKADWPGWACSYQREDGVIVQYGDSRTPQEQWLAVFGDPDQGD